MENPLFILLEDKPMTARRHAAHLPNTLEIDIGNELGVHHVQPFLVPILELGLQTQITNRCELQL